MPENFLKDQNETACIKEQKIFLDRKLNLLWEVVETLKNNKLELFRQ